MRTCRDRASAKHRHQMCVWRTYQNQMEYHDLCKNQFTPPSPDGRAWSSASSGASCRRPGEQSGEKSGRARNHSRLPPRTGHCPNSVLQNGQSYKPSASRDKMTSKRTWQRDRFHVVSVGAKSDGGNSVRTPPPELGAKPRSTAGEADVDPQRLPDRGLSDWQPNVTTTDGQRRAFCSSRLRLNPTKRKPYPDHFRIAQSRFTNSETQVASSREPRATAVLTKEQDASSAEEAFSVKSSSSSSSSAPKTPSESSRMRSSGSS
jgi:hypothetical protein